MFYITNPSAPTGTCYSVDELARLAAILEDYPDVVVVADEVYHHAILDGAEYNHVSSFLRDRTLSVFSAGKSFSCTGWRVGFIAGPPELVGPCRLVHTAINFCPATPVQHALTALYTDGIQVGCGCGHGRVRAGSDVDMIPDIWTSVSPRRRHQPVHVPATTPPPPNTLAGTRENKTHTRIPRRFLPPSPTFSSLPPPPTLPSLLPSYPPSLLSQSFVTANSAVLNKKCQKLCSVLGKAGFTVHRPDAGYFVVAEVPASLIERAGTDCDVELAKWLTMEVGVTALPLTPFYTEPPSDPSRVFLRFAFCKVSQSQPTWPPCMPCVAPCHVPYPTSAHLPGHWTCTHTNTDI